MDLPSHQRSPAVTDPGSAAADAADRLLLDEAAEVIAATPPGQLVVIDDVDGALTLGAADLGAQGIRVHQDLITGERALAAGAEARGRTDRFTSLPLGPELFAGATTVLLRLPRSVDRLAEVAGLIAAFADPGVTLIAAGRIKHMSVSMNDVLRTVFDRVDVSHARQKSRVLTATGARPSAARATLGDWPRTADHPDIGLRVAAYGGVFAGTKVDIGTRFLLENLKRLPKTATAVDLGCGTGLVASALATADPELRVLAVDRSAAAVDSAVATAAANHVSDRVEVVRADGLETLADGSAELVLLNPPFHNDAAVSTAIARHLFAEAARALTQGGELWCVWNSHLQYRPALEKIVGSTRQVARNNKFTVTSSRRR